MILGVRIDAHVVRFWLSYYGIVGVGVRSCSSTRTCEVIPGYCLVSDPSKGGEYV